MPASRAARQKRRRSTIQSGQPSRKRRQQAEPDGSEEDETQPEEETEPEGSPSEREQHHEDDISQLVKNLVRYALACEYSRFPIRREHIRTQVLGQDNGRKFNRVFEEAQMQLKDVFGLRLEELPAKDQSHLSMAERKRMTTASSKPKSTNVWVVKTNLPEPFRTPEILPASMEPTADDEARYVGFYGMVITIIVLKGGEIRQAYLDRCLTRLNSHQWTPVGKSNEGLAKLQRDGYIEKKVTKQDGDEDAVTYHVGARGRAEVTPAVIQKTIREVYGENVPEDFEARLAVTFGRHLRDGDGDGAVE